MEVFAMSDHLKTLANLSVGKSCRVESLISKGLNRRRMHDLGIIPGTKITAVLKSPTGGVTAYQIRDAVIAIRYEDALNIIIS